MALLHARDDEPNDRRVCARLGEDGSGQDAPGDPKNEPVAVVEVDDKTPFVDAAIKKEDPHGGDVASHGRQGQRPAQAHTKAHAQDPEGPDRGSAARGETGRRGGAYAEGGYISIRLTTKAPKIKATNKPTNKPTSDVGDNAHDGRAKANGTHGCGNKVDASDGRDAASPDHKSQSQNQRQARDGAAGGRGRGEFISIGEVAFPSEAVESVCGARFTGDVVFSREVVQAIDRGDTSGPLYAYFSSNHLPGQGQC